MSFGHCGGKHWSSQSDAEWQTLNAWVMERRQSSNESPNNLPIHESANTKDLDGSSRTLLGRGGTSASSFTNCATVNARRGRPKALQLEPNAPGTPKLMAFLNDVRGQ